MPTYTLINPHDPYTFDAPDDDIAETVVALLGGNYGWSIDAAEPGGPSRSGGMVNLLDSDSDAHRNAMAAIERAMTRKLELAAALRTVAISEADRAELDVDPDVWHERHRTSDADLRAIAQARATSCEFAASTEDVEPVMPPGTALPTTIVEHCPDARGGPAFTIVVDPIYDRPDGWTQEHNNPGRPGVVRFAVWDIVGYPEGDQPALYESPGSSSPTENLTEDLAQAQWSAEGFMKWDGCCQWRWREDVYQHADLPSSEGPRELHAALERAIALALDMVGGGLPPLDPPPVLDPVAG